LGPQPPETSISCGFPPVSLVIGDAAAAVSPTDAMAKPAMARFMSGFDMQFLFHR
jgi:hypothetical protein